MATDATCIARIVSGGQSGAERGALDAAIAAGIPYGGWCPAGGLAEDYPTAPGILVTYPHLRPAPSARPEVSARMNVRDCDATLIVLGNQVRSHGASMSASCAAQRGRPLLMTTGVVREVLTWLATLKWPVVLNVTGPRESEQPGVRLLTQRLMHEVLAGAG